MVTLRLDDPDRRWTSVRLDAGPFSGPARRRAGGWERTVDETHLVRLEYNFEVTDPRGRRRNLLDPHAPTIGNPPYGDKSVWQRADYREPGWLRAADPKGRLRRLELPSHLAQPLAVDLWVPRGLSDRRPAPLLWVHDGTDYRERAQLSRWAAHHVGTGLLPPFRIVYADAPRRMQWYSGSERYLRSVRRALTALQEQYPTTPRIAVMGASLGGLTSMVLGARDPRIGAVFSQSGSFFTRLAHDRDNSGFRWYARITRLVDVLGTAPAAHRPLIGMTCGEAEGNYRNNLRLAQRLQANGADVRFVGHPDLHNWTCWRDSLDPTLSNLLRDTWIAVG